ncbi:MAG: DUF721 domain-containing protein [Lewinella sp.]|nr:DUF721 domain-containing protein [Lewinella sp.]
MSDQHHQSDLKKALEAMLDHYKLRGKYTQARVRQLWPKLMGPAINKYTTEVKVYRKNLYVTLSSAALRQELSMGTERIRDLINEELGEEYLEKVVIR